MSILASGKKLLNKIVPLYPNFVLKEHFFLYFVVLSCNKLPTNLNAAIDDVNLKREEETRPGGRYRNVKSATMSTIQLPIYTKKKRAVPDTVPPEWSNKNKEDETTYIESK